MRIGESDAVVDNQPPLQDYAIERVVHHSGYDTPKYANDIALIRLRRSGAQRQLTLTALCLPEGAYAATDATAANGLIAGWGATSAGECANSVRELNA